MKPPPDDPPSAAAEAAAPRKTKRKKRPPHPARVSPRAAEAAEPDAEGSEPEREPELPTFAAAYPQHPELLRLVLLFEEGNYADVNDGVILLERAGAPDDVLAAARDLSSRTRPQPATLVLVVLAMLLLAVLAGWYLSHRHAEPAPPAAGSSQPFPVYTR